MATKAKADEFVRAAESWNDLVTSLNDRTNDEKGDAFERLIQLHLQLEPRYAAQLKNVWLLAEVPLDVREKLNLPAPDKGIDLIAETRSGEFWAIQSKYRDDQTSSLTWDELSTFIGLAFGVCRNISFGLICSTTEHFTQVLQNNERVGFCSIETWAHLDADFFRRAHAKLLHQIAALDPYQPREHQRLAIADGKKHFVEKNEARGKLIMPCASGKSLTAFWIAEELDATWILIAVPSLALIKQTLSVWMREFVAKDMQPDWLCVCSDTSAGKVDDDDLVTYAHDLGVPCITDPDAIADKLKKFSANRRIVFTTYQSGEALSLAARKAGVVFDFGVMDEAHKTTGRRDNMFAHLLFDENVQVKRRMFMTATERRFIGSSNQIASMEDPDIYGETFHMLAFKTALECQPPILSDYQVITIGVRESDVARLISNNAYIKPDKGKWAEVTAQTFAALVALQKAIAQNGIKHAVSFHSSIARAEQFKRFFDELAASSGDKLFAASYHVSGKMPTSVRDSKIRAFLSSAPSLLTNARCLTEGVDVPAIDCVLFADPKTSKVDIVQASGRALRLYDGKQLGYIIVPCVVSEGASIEQVRQNAAFMFVLDVICALASQDERIIEEFRAVSQGSRHRSRPIVSFNLTEVVAQNINTEEFVRAVELECWNKLARLAWRPFVEAREFARSLRLDDLEAWLRWTRGQMPEKVKRPVDVPLAPHKVYAEWDGWRDWLGTGMLPFEEARKFARGLGLTGQRQWRDYKAGKFPKLPPKPENIPSGPDIHYADDGWAGWPDWLGTDNKSPRMNTRPFAEARQFARSLGLSSPKQWEAFCRGELPEKGALPTNIPPRPNRYYRHKGWLNWGDWLNCDFKAPERKRIPSRFKFRSYDEAKAFVHPLKLGSGSEWEKYVKGEKPELVQCPSDIPRNPKGSYAGRGWKGWGDFLGSGNIAPRDKKKFCLPFEQARDFVRKLGLKSSVEWYAYRKGLIPGKPPIPPNIPGNPKSIYRESWINYQDWLGAPDKQSKWRPFEPARAWARTLGLRTAREWFRFSDGEMPDKGSKPADIPKDVYTAYEKKGWKGMHDWLGVA